MSRMAQAEVFAPDEVVSTFSVSRVGIFASVFEHSSDLIQRSRPDVVAVWDDTEVARRWLLICPVRKNSAGDPQEPRRKGDWLRPRCLSPFRHEQRDYTSVQRRIQSFTPTNDKSTSATLATSQPKQEFSDHPVGVVIPAAIGREAAPEGVSPIAMQSQVTADRFFSPNALIPADDQRLGPQASSHRFGCSDKGFLALSVC